MRTTVPGNQYMQNNTNPLFATTSSFRTENFSLALTTGWLSLDDLPR